ncbi:MAG: hypothetical protein HYU41_18235 [Candidatus Rokubacteria bacterium]|nr:hypothetical protein [Candidatus Rokubacteria bacterium]
MLVVAQSELAYTLGHLGRLREALAHLDRQRRLYDPVLHERYAALNALDPFIAGRCQAGRLLWLLGYPDRALAAVDGAVRMARDLRVPSGLGFALVYAAYVHQMRREPDRVRERTEEALALATEHGLADVMGWSAIWRGWAVAVETAGRDGIDAIRQGLAAQRAFGSEIVRPHALALLAEACRLGGRLDEARAAVDEAAAQAARTGDRYYEPEVHRLRGKLLLAASADAVAEAEAGVRTAIDLARAMDARSLELRATLSLARILTGRGERAAAQIAIDAVYKRFEEGFTTADLREAEARRRE